MALTGASYSAFEAITTRIGWYAADKIERYTPVQVSSDGLFEAADGTGQFVGIAAYDAASADEIVTVVQGAYPAKVTEQINPGDAVTISVDGGAFSKAGVGDVVYGTALTGGSSDELCTILTCIPTITK